jgi:heat-inducible transcriptional repressor
MMTDRQQFLFQELVEEYIRDARPVGSKFLSEHVGDLSPATIRNEMAALEEEGWVTHPHPSAGRIPTEKGYRYYVEHLLKPEVLSDTSQQQFRRALNRTEVFSMQVKQFAKSAADFVEEAVIVGFGTDELYVTGMTHLFQKPEFRGEDHVVSLGPILDHFDDVVQKLLPKVERVDIRVGRENAFGASCAVVMTTFHPRRGKTALFSILGPMRMNYARNRATVEFARELFHHS